MEVGQVASLGDVLGCFGVVARLILRQPLGVRLEFRAVRRGDELLLIRVQVVLLLSFFQQATLVHDGFLSRALPLFRHERLDVPRLALDALGVRGGELRATRRVVRFDMRVVFEERGVLRERGGVHLGSLRRATTSGRDGLGLVGDGRFGRRVACGTGQTHLLVAPRGGLLAENLGVPAGLDPGGALVPVVAVVGIRERRDGAAQRLRRALLLRGGVQTVLERSAHGRVAKAEPAHGERGECARKHPRARRVARSGEVARAKGRRSSSVTRRVPTSDRPSGRIFRRSTVWRHTA